MGEWLTRYQATPTGQLTAWQVKASDHRLENPATRDQFSYLHFSTKDWFVSGLGASRALFL